MKLKYVIAIIFFFYLSTPINAQDNRAAQQEDICNYLLLETGKILTDKGWTTIFPEKNKSILNAYRHVENYCMLTVLIETGRPVQQTITVSITINDKQVSSVFNIKKDDDGNSLITLIIPFVLKYSLPDEQSLPVDRIYSSGFSVGYNRTHDNRHFFPEYGQGSFYTSLFLVYDPAINVKSQNVTLRIADYTKFDFYFAYDSHVRENFFNVDTIIYGRNLYTENNSNKDKISNRTVYGFFNGFEYFRPGFYNNALEWNRKIYKKQPHIQYTIWRALQWGFINTYTNGAVYKSSFMIGFGPSINSSLTATHVTEEEEKELSHIFKSKNYRKQNYYYSVSLPVAASFEIDRLFNFRFGAGYNLYIFYPVQNEKANDFANILKISAGYYFTANCLFNVNYEYWYMRGKVRRVVNEHSWNRLVLEVKFLF